MTNRSIHGVMRGLSKGLVLGVLTLRLAAQEAAPAAAAPGAPATAEPARAAPDAPATAPAAPAAPIATAKVQAGTYTLESRGPWTPQDRLTARPPELWLHYMHGVIDHFAKPVPWEEQLTEAQPAETWLDKTAVLQGNPFRTSPMPALRLAAGQELVCGKPLLPPDQLAECAGKTVRVFVWMSGRDTGQGHYLWSAVPRLDVLLTDAAGAVVRTFPGTMATRGSFPWHCYYRDVAIPAVPDVAGGEGTVALSDGQTRARGLYVRALNPASGMAWFSSVSWEVLDATKACAPGDLQDPATGSAAPNARFDELPVHLASPKVLPAGSAPTRPWNFLVGAAGGAVNTPEVLTIAGLDTYLKSTARQDPHHLLQGVTRLPEWYHSGTTFKCLPPTPADWLAVLGNRMVAAQDADTGFWGYEQMPRSMAVTAAVVERLFGGSLFARADRPAVPQPWLACGDLALPNPDRIVRTVLAQQAGLDEKQRAKGGWSLVATHFATAEQVEVDTSCALGATADAVFLLRRCTAALNGTQPARCERAIREALERVWATCLLPSGLWKQTSRDAGPTLGGVMARLVEASPLLEFRLNPLVKLPVLPEDLTAAEGSVTITWAAPADDAVALRVYIAPAGTVPERLADKYLAGIIQRSDGDVRTMDPLAGVLAMRRAARATWGSSGFEEGAYTSWKLGQVPAALPITLKGAPVTVVLPKDPNAIVYACAVNTYGECSRPVTLPVKLGDKTATTAPDEAEAVPVAPAETAPAPAAPVETAPAPAAPAAAAPPPKPAAAPAAADW